MKELTNKEELELIALIGQGDKDAKAKFEAYIKEIVLYNEWWRLCGDAQAQLIEGLYSAQDKDAIKAVLLVYIENRGIALYGSELSNLIIEGNTYFDDFLKVYLQKWNLKDFEEEEIVNQFFRGNTRAKEFLKYYIQWHMLRDKAQLMLVVDNADAKEIIKDYKQRYKLCEKAEKKLEESGIKL